MVAFQKLNGSTKMGILNYLRNMNMLFMQGIWRKDTPSKWNAISSATIDEKIGLSGVSDFSKEILNRDKTSDVENVFFELSLTEYAVPEGAKKKNMKFV